MRVYTTVLQVGKQLNRQMFVQYLKDEYENREKQQLKILQDASGIVTAAKSQVIQGNIIYTDEFVLSQEGFVNYLYVYTSAEDLEESEKEQEPRWPRLMNRLMDNGLTACCQFPWKQKRIGSRYRFEAVRSKILSELLQKQQKKSRETESAYEELLELKEQEQKQEVAKLQEENEKLTRQFNDCMRKHLKQGDTCADTVKFSCSESQFYDGEIRDTILKVIQSEKNRMDMDPNQTGRRKYHLLCALLNENQIQGNGVKMAAEVKKILTRIDRVSPKERRKLRSLGFVDRVSRHNKLYFHNDDRYMLVLASTPSDGHAASNVAAEAVRMLFE